jgi:hypothetical protein
MKLEIRERDRRALLILGLAVALYVIASQIAFPAFDMLRNASDMSAGKEQDLMRYRRALARKGQYTQLIEQATRSVGEAESRLINGSNSSIASVELQTIVEEAARKVEISLGQRSMSAARRKDDFYNEITMTLGFECTLNQLTSFLSEIRSSPKFISVRTAQVTPVQVVHAAPANADVKKTVRVNLTLAAILSSPPVAPKG